MISKNLDLNVAKDINYGAIGEIKPVIKVVSS